MDAKQGTAVGKMHNNSDGLVDGQFACPIDNEFFRFAVEIALPEWKWI